MGMKLGSLVVILLAVFLAKISFETAMAEKTTVVNERSPASIDLSYNQHMSQNMVHH